MMMCVIIFSLQNSSVKAVTNTVVANNSTVSATEAGADQSQSSQPFIVSDVNLSDLHMTVGSSSMSGTFSMQSFEGSQSNISYGIMAVGEKGILGVTKLGTIDILHKGEIKKVTFLYTMPAHVTGKVSFILSAYTDAGLPIGSLSLKTISLKGLPSTLTCNHETSATSSMVCTAKVGSTQTVAYYKTLFVKPFSIESIITTQKQTTLNTKNIPAGKWYVIVTDTANGEEQVLTHRVEGSYAHIKGVMSDTKDGALASNVSIDSYHIQGATLQLTLKDGKKNCGESSVPYEGVNLTVKTISSCKKGELQVILLDANKAVLDTFATTFETIAYEKVPSKVVATTTTTTNSVPSDKDGYTGYLLLAVVVVLAIGWLLYRKYGKMPISVIALLVVLVSFGASPAKVEALVFDEAIDACQIPGNCSGTEIAWHCRMSVNTSKSSYARGEGMTITQDGELDYDIAANGAGTCDGDINSTDGVSPAYNGASNLSYINVTSATLTTNWFIGVQSITFNNSYTTVIPNTLPLGSNYVSVRYEVFGATFGNKGWNPNSTQTNVPLTFTVDNPLPSVSLYFSYLKEKVKAFSL